MVSTVVPRKIRDPQGHAPKAYWHNKLMLCYTVPSSSHQTWWGHNEFPRLTFEKSQNGMKRTPISTRSSASKHTLVLPNTKCHFTEAETGATHISTWIRAKALSWCPRGHTHCSFRSTRIHSEGGLTARSPRGPDTHLEQAII